MDPAVRKKLIEDTIAQEEKRLGLNIPIAIRNFRYLSNALTLNLGRAINMTSDSGSKQVRLILLERLPATLLLMGISQLFLFFSSIFVALNLSRRYGNFWDKAGGRAFAHLGGAALVLWHFSDPDLCGAPESAALWRHGRFTAAIESIRLQPEPAEAFDPAGFVPGAQFLFPQHL